MKLMDEKLTHHNELLSELRDGQQTLRQDGIQGTLENLLDRLNAMERIPNKGPEQVQGIGDRLLPLPVHDDRQPRPQQGVVHNPK